MNIMLVLFYNSKEFEKTIITGWISYTGKKMNKDTYCDYQYKVKWTNLHANNKLSIIPNPLVLSFDIEVNSHNINMFPKAINPDDKVFQISCNFTLILPIVVT